MIYKIIFIYLVGFVIFAILNTFALYWGTKDVEDSKIKGATVAIFWFLELPMIILDLLKRRCKK